MGEVRPQKKALRPSIKQETRGEQGALGGTPTSCRARGPQSWSRCTQLRDTPESFVHGPIPADEGTGRVEQSPEDGEAEPRTSRGVHAEPGERGQEVQEESNGAG